MTEKRKLEFFLLRYVPNAVRGEFVNFGLVMLESGGDGGGFAGVHFTTDWRRARCLDPGIDVEMLEALGRDVKQRLDDVQKRALLLHEMMDAYSNTVQLSAVQHCLTEDPELELKKLVSQFVDAPQIQLIGEKQRRTAGRKWIRTEMDKAFQAAGVWNMVERNLPASIYTNTEDKYTFDFSYVSGNEVKVFHAVSLMENLREAELFAFRVSKIGPAMTTLRQQTPRFTAVVEDVFNSADKEVVPVLALMKDEKIRVARLREMAQIAETARVELRA
jgi:hypothetical protein